MGGPDPYRIQRSKFQKRSRTLITKAHQLAHICGANVYLFIDHPRDTVTYNSAEDSSWPPPDEMLVYLHLGLQQILWLKALQEYHYPNLRRENPFSMEDEKPDSDLHELKRLLQYFAMRADLLQSLDSPSQTQHDAPSNITLGEKTERPHDTLT